MGNEVIYIRANKGGLGGRSSDKYSLGVRSMKELDGSEAIEFSIGRAQNKYYGTKLATAWVKIPFNKAHEVACLISHLVHTEFPCKGEGPHTSQHTSHADLRFQINVDMCTLLHDREGLKERILAEASNKIDEMLYKKEE